MFRQSFYEQMSKFVTKLSIFSNRVKINFFKYFPLVSSYVLLLSKFAEQQALILAIYRALNIRNLITLFNIRSYLKDFITIHISLHQHHHHYTRHNTQQKENHLIIQLPALLYFVCIQSIFTLHVLAAFSFSC